MAEGRRISLAAYWEAARLKTRAVHTALVPMEKPVAMIRKRTVAELLQDEVYMIGGWKSEEEELPARMKLLTDRYRDSIVPSKCGSRWFPKKGHTTLFLCRCITCGRSMISDGNHRFAALAMAGRFEDVVTCYEMAGSKWPAGVLDFSRICRCPWTRQKWSAEKSRAYDH